MVDAVPSRGAVVGNSTPGAAVSTLCPLCAARPPWLSTAAWPSRSCTAALPPSVSEPASTLTPPASASPDATVYEHASFVSSLPCAAHVAVLSALPTFSASEIESPE